MRKIKEVLRLKFEAKPNHEKIAAATGMSKGAVTNAVQRALHNGLAWSLPAELDEAGLEALMYRKTAPPDRYVQPDYAVIHQELKRKGVTLQLLWRSTRKRTDRARTGTASSAGIITNTAGGLPARCVRCTANARRK
jgi:hypothetical protein